MAALIEACEDRDFPAHIALVGSNVPGASGLLHAEGKGIPTFAIDQEHFTERADFEAELDRRLREARIELVCLAGFMRLLSPDFVAAWRNRLINIHPSLLPALPGLRTHERALEAGVKIHGATVHFVRAETDQGPIIAQAAVPVLHGDDVETIAARVLAVEHRLYPLALQLVASGAAKLAGDVVVLENAGADPAAALLCPTDETLFAASER